MLTARNKSKIRQTQDYQGGIFMSFFLRLFSYKELFQPRRVGMDHGRGRWFPVIGRTASWRGKEELQ